MHIIILYEEIPEDSNIFIIKNANEEEIEIAKTAHGYTINSSDFDEEKSEAVNLIENFIKTKRALIVSDEAPLIIQNTECIVIKCGFWV